MFLFIKPLKKLLLIVPKKSRRTAKLQNVVLKYVFIFYLIVFLSKTKNTNIIILNNSKTNRED